MQGANCFEVCIYKFCLVPIQDSTAQFGKKSQTGFLPQFKVWKTKESCMYFWFSNGRSGAKRRRRLADAIVRCCPSKSATIYPLQIQDVGDLSRAFATFGKNVRLRRNTPQIWGIRLYLVGTHSLCPAIFSVSSGCAAPPQLHIAPFCPQQSCCGLLCVFGTSLPFSTSVSLKFPHFKFTEVFYVNVPQQSIPIAADKFF